MQTHLRRRSVQLEAQTKVDAWHRPCSILAARMVGWPFATWCVSTKARTIGRWRIVASIQLRSANILLRLVRLLVFPTGHYPPVAARILSFSICKILPDIKRLFWLFIFCPPIFVRSPIGPKMSGPTVSSLTTKKSHQHCCWWLTVSFD